MILRYKRQCILCAIFFIFEWPFCPGENNFSDNINICFAKISFDYPLFLWRMSKFCAFLSNMEGDESVLRGCCASPFKNPCSTRDGWQEAKFVYCKISVTVMCLHFMCRFLVKYLSFVPIESENVISESIFSFSRKIWLFWGSCLPVVQILRFWLYSTDLRVSCALVDNTFSHFCHENIDKSYGHYCTHRRSVDL